MNIKNFMSDYKKMFYLVLFFGFALRLVMFFYGLKYIPLYSDECISGLVSFDFLKGKFTPFLFGQAYGGIAESIINAPLQLILGSTKVTVRLLNFVCSFLSIIVVYRLAKTFFSEKIAVLSALLIAVPPSYINLFSAIGIPQNCITFLGCAVMLWMAGEIAKKPEHSLSKWIIWGIFAGISWWEHFITAAAIGASIFYIFVKDKKFFLRKGVWIGGFFFFLSSSPFWIYNLKTSWETFSAIKSVSFAKSIELFQTLMTFTFPSLLGFHPALFIDSVHFAQIPGFLFILLGASYVILFAVFILSRAKNIIGSVFLSKKLTQGPELLFVYVILVFAIFARSNRAAWWSIRYPSFALVAIPIILAYSLNLIREKFRLLSSILIGIILFANIYGHATVLAYWANPEFVEKMADLPPTEHLIKFLEKEKIEGVYSHFWIANRLMYETNQEIVSAPAYDERFGRYEPHYLPQLEKKERIAYVFYDGLGIKAGQFESAIKNAGGSYEKRRIGPFIVFYNFIPAWENFEKVSLENAEIEVSDNPKDARLAIDSDLKTRWGSAGAQKPGMFFTIKLKETAPLTKIVLKLGKYRHDLPRGFSVFVSENGRKWEQVYNEPDSFAGVFWDASQPKWITAKDYFTAVFKPVNAKFIKIVQTNEDAKFDWSIAEIELWKNS